MLNKVQIIGRLGQDPELKYGQSGTAVLNMSVATDEGYTDRDGNKVDRTEWHRIVCYKSQAENCAKFLGKGSLVHVEGSLQTRKWQDQNGQDRYTTEIKAQRVQFLDRKGDNNQNGHTTQDPQAQYQRGTTRNAPPQPREYGQGRPSVDDDLGPAFPQQDDLPW